jgi:HK97 gp10 family phage protein
MSIKVQITDRAPEFRRRAEHALIESLHEAADTLEGRAKQEVPVRTGTLRSSIHTEVEERRKELELVSGGKGARHAHLVEFGTVHMPPDPFMRRSVDRERLTVLRTIRKGQERLV